MTDTLVTADDVCRAAERVLRAHLPEWVIGYPDLVDVTDWQQVPTEAALLSAELPAGAIACPGTAGSPTSRGLGRYDAPFRLVVAVYDRGEDFTDVASRTRRWAAMVRAVIVQHRRLDGLAESITWVGEDYIQRPGAGDAATLGGCAVSFDVLLRDVVPTTSPSRPGSPPPTAVTSTRATVTVRRAPATPQE